MQVNNFQPGTYYIKFTGAELPRTFKLYHNKYGLYYFRVLQGKAPRIKFNLVHPGQYTANAPFEVVKVNEIEVPENLPLLPDYERDEVKDFVIQDNFDFTGSPARVFVKEGRVETSRNFYNLPKPVRVFILLHEVGHFFYGINQADIKKAESMNDRDAREYLTKRRNESEAKCDLFALIQYLRMGYNRSMAFYSLSRVLKESQANIERLKKLIGNIQVTQKAKIL